MPAIIRDSFVPSHDERLDDARPSMAKASLKNLDASSDTQWRERFGRVVARCFELAGKSQKEGAALIGRSEQQIARWIAAADRPQFDRIWAVSELRLPLITALVELAEPEGVYYETTVHVPSKRRLA